MWAGQASWILRRFRSLAYGVWPMLSSPLLLAICILFDEIVCKLENWLVKL